MNKFALAAIIIGAVALGGVTVYYAYPKMTNQDSTLTAQNGDTIYVNYTGKLTNGTVFDSSLQPGRQPFGFVLGKGMVIRGWDEGVLGMSIGEKKTLTISPDKGYGSQGVSDGMGGYVIPPNSTLVFDIEVMDIKRR